MKFCNLTVHNKPTADASTLLELGPKFYTQLTEMPKSNTSRMTCRFERVVGSKFCLGPSSFGENYEMPRLRMKMRNFNYQKLQD